MAPTDCGSSVCTACSSSCHFPSQNKPHVGLCDCGCHSSVVASKLWYPQTLVLVFASCRPSRKSEIITPNLTQDQHIVVWLHSNLNKSFLLFSDAGSATSQSSENECYAALPPPPKKKQEFTKISTKLSKKSVSVSLALLSCWSVHYTIEHK